MKKLIYLTIALVLSGGLLLSCQLEEQPYSFLKPEQFYQSASDAEAALTTVYTGVTNLYGRVGYQLPDYSADQGFPRAVVGREQFTVFSYDATNDLVAQYWSTCYQGIDRANQVLQNVPNITMDAVRKRQILAEAAFLRAIFHFHLVKSFGDVPIKQKTVADLTDIVTLEQGKNTAQDVYAFILNDLATAERDLPATPRERGRATSGAATALLAKVNLYAGDWVKAGEKAQALIATNRYSLMPSLLDLYNPLREDASRVEVIFAAEFSSLPNLNRTDMLGFFSPANSPPVFGKVAYGSHFGFLSFFRSFDPTDKRRQLLDTAYVNSQGRLIGQRDANPRDRVIVKKYMDPNSVAENGENNFPLLRLADVYLIAAEAEARANGATPKAYAAINVVRKRAGLSDLTPGLGKDAFIDAVLQERSWELCFEADRWYDLTRTGKFKLVANVLNSYYTVRPVLDKHRFFPIPNGEILANPSIEQNAAWK